MAEYDETPPRADHEVAAAPPPEAAPEGPRRQAPAPVNDIQRRGESRALHPVLPSKHAQAMVRTPPPSGWKAWWPVFAGVLLAVFAPDLRNLALQWEPWGMRLIFPYVLLPGQREVGLSEELTRTMPQLMLYLQFPLEGLLTRLTFRRGIGLAGALGQLIFLHAIGALVLFLVSGTTPP